MAEEKMSVEVEVALEARLAGADPRAEPYRIGSLSIDVPLRLGVDGFRAQPNPRNRVDEIIITPDQVGMLERLADALYEAASAMRKRAAELAIVRARVEEADRG